jgi:hypothetical protein
VWPEDVVHQSLEGSGGVGEAEGHDGVFEVTVARPKCRLVDVLLMDTNLMIAVTKVDFGEHSGTVKAVEKLVHAGEGIRILDRGVIDGAVVDA